MNSKEVFVNIVLFVIIVSARRGGETCHSLN